MKDSLKMVMLNAPKGGWGVSGNGRVGNRSLGTVNVNWAPREMTTSWVTGQSRATVCVCACRRECVQTRDGEFEGTRGREMVIYASKALMGRRITKMGRRRQEEAVKMLCCVQSVNRVGEEGKTVCHCI